MRRIFSLRVANYFIIPNKTAQNHSSSASSPLISETNLYELHHKARLAIKPGITGMWQVSGRSEITDFEEVVRLDREYITNWNIGMDIKILMKTVMVVLRRDGAV